MIRILSSLRNLRYRCGIRIIATRCVTRINILAWHSALLLWDCQGLVWRWKGGGIYRELGHYRLELWGADDA